LRLPRATFGSHLLEATLQRIAYPGQGVGRLNELPIPFRAVATDLVTGQMVVLDKTSLFSAMRASMSIPGAFTPIEIDGRLLIDGGMVRNLPVDVARSMGAQVVIAVNVGTPLAKREELKSALDVAQQMINILTEQNVERSLTELGAADILIAPDLHEFSASDFANGKAIIARGEAAARDPKLHDKLAALGIEAQAYAGWDAARTASATKPVTVQIADIKIENTQRTNPEVLKRELRIEPGEPLNAEQLAEKVARLSARGDFERVDYALLGTGTTRDLVVRPVETDWGGNTLRFGGQLESNFRDSNRFKLVALHTMTWVNSLGAEWRNLASIGFERSLQSEFYQPLSAGRDWFVSANLNYTGTDQTVALSNGTSLRIGSNTTAMTLFVGRYLGLSGEVRLGVGRIHQALVPRDAGGVNTQRSTFDTGLLQFRWDTLDNLNFPRQGQNIVVALARTGTLVNSEDRSDSIYADGNAATSWKNTSLVGTLRYGEARRGVAPLSLGGFLNLSGTDQASLTGNHVVFARAVLLQKGFLSGGFGQNIRVGLSVELGNAFADRSDIRLGQMKRALTVLAGAESFLGPLYLGYGRTFGVGGGSGVYLYLGRP
jgi:NTE family protein